MKTIILLIIILFISACTKQINNAQENIIEGPGVIEETDQETTKPISESVEEPKSVISWDEFFNQCRTRYPETRWNNPTLAQGYLDECESDYAEKYGLLEYCHKVDDLNMRDNCYLGVAIKKQDQEICRQYLTGSRKTECVKSITFKYLT